MDELNVNQQIKPDANQNADKSQVVQVQAVPAALQELKKLQEEQRKEEDEEDHDEQKLQVKSEVLNAIELPEVVEQPKPQTINEIEPKSEESDTESSTSTSDGEVGPYLSEEEEYEDYGDDLDQEIYFDDDAQLEDYEHFF
ncbi:uncharacterized protein LOC115633342 [Scaptodrosophila lebanonensis]|uniref:Uncharacterized protein LOC115633342 n=1 Tax=Drosophila lebanonensis TaxID=7225 RepID=A0A6J2UEQ5_DROLE|nr:uncharacterized protein LOC115633342 [Scaptodrosophila lebanonensis]